MTARRPAAVPGVWRAGHPRTPPALRTRGLRDVDEETRRIVEDCYEDALDTLREHQDSLERLAHRLLEAETLNEQEAREAAGRPESTATKP